MKTESRLVSTRILNGAVNRMKESPGHEWGSCRCAFWLLLALGAGYPQMVSGASGASSGALELPKIDAPQSMSLKAQAKLEKELSDCRSQSSSLAEKTKALESAATVAGKADAECKQLQESKAALEKQLAEERSRLKEFEKKAAAAEAAAKQTGEAKAALEKQLAAEQAARAEAEKKLAARPSSPLPATVSGTASSATLSQAGAPLPDSSYTDPTTGMEFVWVAGGEFQMGDTFGDGDPYEKPPSHKTRITGFWMGKHEVTQGEWVKVMVKNPSKFQKGDRYPVEQVSWDMVQNFITKLNKSGKPQYRLPSEAEWEYAARAGGKKVRFGTGKDTIGPEEASFNASEQYKKDYSRSGRYRQETTPVNIFDPNSLGLHDMSGNVWEWVRDCWHSSYANAPSDGSAWERNCEGSGRVARGGSWDRNPGSLRAANRNYYTPGFACSILGFRLVLPSSASGK
jgi:formylglycine-generating enzyme required for sulfatase activity